MVDEEEKPTAVPYQPAERANPAGAEAARIADSAAAGSAGFGERPVTEPGRAAGTGLTGQAPGSPTTGQAPAAPTGTVTRGQPPAAPTGTVMTGQPSAAPTGTVMADPPPAAPPGTTTGPERIRPRRDLALQFLRAVRAGWARGIGLIASAIMIAAVIIAVIFAMHIVFVVFNANPANSIVESVNRWAQQFAWRFSSLFTPHSQRLAVVANYGIAAIAYLVAGRIAAGIIRRFA